jgi:hypothetical protein
MLLPLLVMVLKEYPSNDDIREYAMYMIDSACSTLNDKKIIEKSGAMKPLVALLVFNTINESVKNTVRALIANIENNTAYYTYLLARESTSR